MPIDRLLVGLVLAIVLYAADDLALSTVLPAVTAELHGDALFGASYTVFLLCNLASLVATGYWIDRIGVARPFVAGMALFAVGLALAVVTPDMGLFIVSRGLQGLGGGAVQAVVTATLTLAWRGAARQRAISWVTTGWMVPALAGPAAAGWITERWNWRGVFVALIGLGAITAVLALPRLRGVRAAVGDHGDTPEAPPLPGAMVRDALMIAAGVGLALAGVARGDVAGYGVVVIALLLLRTPLANSLPARFWSGDSALAAPMLLRLLACATFFGLEAWLPWAAQRSALATPLVAGLVLSSAAIGWVATTWWVELVLPRYGAARVLWLAWALLCAGVALTWIALLHRAPLTWLFGGWTTAGAAMGIIYPVVAKLAMDRAEAGHEGRLSMMLGLADTLGITAAIGIGGALLHAETDGALARVVLLCWALAAPLVVLPLLLWRRRRYWATVA